MLGPAGAPQPPPSLLEEAVWPDEEPPLIFCARQGVRLLPLALRLVESGAACRMASLDRLGRDGLAALHLACASDDLCELASSLLVAGARIDVRSQDDPSASRVGGRTPLHTAGAAGASAAARLLLGRCPALAAVADWEGELAAHAAWYGAHSRLAEELAEAAIAAAGAADVAEPAVIRDEAAELAATIRRFAAEGGDAAEAERESARRLHWMSVRERYRDRLDVSTRPPMRLAHLLRGVWSGEQCEWLVAEVRRAACLHGWSSARHRNYATVDLPLWRVPAAAAWVRAQMRDIILPRMGAAFGISPSRLHLCEAFIVRYETCDEDGGVSQPSLGYHRDDTLLSLNVLLTHGFEGGGTAFAEPTPLHVWEPPHPPALEPAVPSPPSADGADGAAASQPGLLAQLVQGGLLPPAQEPCLRVCGERGDCVMHCGQHLHGGATVTSGRRLVLVCFVDELQPPP